MVEPSYFSRSSKADGPIGSRYPWSDSIGLSIHALRNAKRGSRPSFTEAANARIAQPLYDYVKEKFSSELGRTIASGSFGASMQARLVNDVPVTFWIERPPKYPD